MDYYSSQITKINEVSCRLPALEINPLETGVSYHQYAGGAGRASFVGQYKRQENALLPGMLYSDGQELCPICESQKRDHSVIMVVENTRDLPLTRKQENTTALPRPALSDFSHLGIGPGRYPAEGADGELQKKR